jgi:hypothetical protein
MFKEIGENVSPLFLNKITAPAQKKADPKANNDPIII